MTRPIQDPQAAQALERQYGLRGAISLLLDEVVVPTSVVGDFAGSSPWETRRTGMDMQTSPAGGVGIYSGYLIQPGANTVLVVEDVRSEYSSTDPHVWKLMRPVDVAAITVVATSAVAQTNGRVLSTGFLPQLAATASIVTHNSLVIGGEIYRTRGPNIQQLGVAIKRGIVLDGRDPAGLGGLLVLCQAANLQMRAGVHVTEYLPTGSL